MEMDTTGAITLISTLAVLLAPDAVAVTSNVTVVFAVTIGAVYVAVMPFAAAVKVPSPAGSVGQETTAFVGVTVAVNVTVAPALTCAGLDTLIDTVSFFEPLPPHAAISSSDIAAANTPITF